MMTQVRRHRHGIPAFLLLLLLTVSFGLRLAPLGHYVTPDEPAWIYRSIRFASALSTGDWDAIPVTGHPGVTTMWLGAAGVISQRLLSPAESAIHLSWIRRTAWLSPNNGEAFQHLAFFLPFGRIAVALTTLFGLAVLYALVERLFDWPGAFLGVGLVALDPFYIGHAGLLHTDALVATFSLLALTAALNGLAPTARALWWGLAGLLTGLALLTKTPALVLVPLILFLIVFRHARGTAHSRLVSRALRDGCIYVLSAIATVFILHPGFWADPMGTMSTLSAFTVRHVDMAERPIFFAGQMTYAPGPAFYPAVLIYRASPIVLVGLVPALVVAIRGRAKSRRAVAPLFLFALALGVLMSFGAKKHDRYVLPAFPAMALCAALGISALLDRYAGRSTGPPRDAGSAQLSAPAVRDWGLTCRIAVVAGQLLLALAFVPYPLTYFNPILGGPSSGSRVLSADWGESDGASARWLNRLPGGVNLTVAASSVPTFAPMFAGRTVPLSQASLADYIVDSSGLALSLSDGLPVAHVTSVGCLDRAIIYANGAFRDQNAYLSSRAESEDLIVLDAHAPLESRYSGLGKLVSVAGLIDLHAISNRLSAASSRSSSIWVVSDSSASPITASQLDREIDRIADPMAAVVVAGVTVTHHELRISPGHAQHSRWIAFGNDLLLVDALLPAEPVQGHFPVFLRWQARVPTMDDVTVSVQMRDTADHLWSEVGQLIVDDRTFPTSEWEPTYWADNVLMVKPPELTPPDEYSIQITLLDEAGAQLGATGADGRFLGVRANLGTVRISRPEEPLGSRLCGMPTIAAGPLTICQPLPRPQTVLSGDAFALSVAWLADTAPQVDYLVQWRLVDGAGNLALEHSGPVSPFPTSDWLAGDSFESRYDVRLRPLVSAGTYNLTLNILSPNGSTVLAQDRVLSEVEVVPRNRSFELPSGISHRLDLTLGDRVHLRGFDLDLVDAQPGSDLPLTLYWQAGGPTDLNYTVFVHLVGADGHLHGQIDRFPADGIAPTSGWAPDQVVVDRLSLPIAVDAPAGKYRISVGMYDASNGNRLPIADAMGNILPDGQFLLSREVTVAGDMQ